MITRFSFEGKKVLVTGGAGFIGSHTVDALIGEGANVVVVDNMSSGEEGNIHPLARVYDINIADVEFEKVLEEERPDIIYHLAWFVAPHQSGMSVMKYVDSVVGSLRILEKLKEIGVEKVIFSSSGFLYGESCFPPAKESMGVRLLSAYSASKYAVENYLEYFYHVHAIPYVILRYSTVFGPRQTSGAVADYVAKLREGKQAEIWGDGSASRDYVYVADVVRANLLAMIAPDDCGSPIYNVSTKMETTLNSMYGKIAYLLHKDFSPVYHPSRPEEIRRLVLDNSKIEKYLGWYPTFSLDEGLSLYLGSL